MQIRGLLTAASMALVVAGSATAQEDTPPDDGSPEMQLDAPADVVPVQPSVAPSVSATAAPQSNVVFADDMQDAVRGRMPKSSSDPDTKFAYESGEYLVSVASKNSGNGLISLPPRIRDSTLSIEARVTETGPNSGVYLGCRSTSGGAYGLGVFPGLRSYLINKSINGKNTFLQPLVVFAAIRGGTGVNRLDFICAGNSLAARINGEVTPVVRDSDLTEGISSFGVIRPNQDRLAEVRFKNLALSITDANMLTAGH